MNIICEHEPGVGASSIILRQGRSLSGAEGGLTIRLRFICADMQRIWTHNSRRRRTGGRKVRRSGLSWGYRDLGSQARDMEALSRSGTCLFRMDVVMRV